jgi:hypothetical protein
LLPTPKPRFTPIQLLWALNPVEEFLTSIAIPALVIASPSIETSSASTTKASIVGGPAA